MSLDDAPHGGVYEYQTRSASDIGTSDYLAAIMRRCMNSFDFAFMLLGEFEVSGSELVESVCGFVDEGKCDQAADRLHALKGSSGIVCMDRLSEIAAVAERSAQKGLLDEVAQHANELKSELACCLNLIRVIRDYRRIEQ